MTIASRSKASAQRPELSLALWTTWAFVIVFGMLELQDVMWSVSPRVTGTPAFLLRWGLLLVPPLLMGAGLGLGILRGVQHVLIAVCAIALGWYSVTSFRGLWIRPGTLDDWRIPTSLWTRAMILPFLLGLGSGIGLGRLAPHALTLRRSSVALALFAMLAATDTFLLLRWPSESVFPPSRPVVLLATALLSLGLLVGEARNA